MDPIRSRTPSPARELLPGPQPDGVQPTADRGVSPPAGGPLDGLPARRTMSRTRLPSPPAPLPAFSAGSFSDLLRQFDPSLFNTSLFDSLPPFGAHHTEAATGEWDEVQSGLRAADAPPPTMRVAVTAARQAGAATTCCATLRRFAGRAGGSTHARLQPAATGEDQTEGSFDSGAAPRGTGRPWVYTRAHRCAQPTPGSVRDRRCQVSGHDRSVARGDTRSDRWRRQTVVRRTRSGGLAHGGGRVERSTVTVGHRPTSQDCKTWRRDRSGGSACMAQCTDGCPPEPDPGAGGGHRQQWRRQAGAGEHCCPVISP